MSYEAKDIQSLSFLEGTRRRIQMYLGSDDIEGTYQGFKEVINNSTDEALAGYGNRIEIVVNEKENSISVRDFGRGVPFLVKEDGTNILVDIYTKAHTGGKFSNNNYKNAAGLNGCGGSCVCLSSKSFIVKSFRDGTQAEARFTKGVNNYYKETKTKEKNGTYVWFIPDEEVFKNGEIGYTFTRVCQEIKDVSFLYKGLSFSIKNAETGDEKTFSASNGIIDFVKEEVKKPLNQHIVYITETDGTDSIEIAFQWGVKHEKPYTFVNGLRCPEGGVNLTGARSALTRTFNSLSGKNFDAENIRKNLFYVMNFKIANPSFANQTKSKINSPSARTLASKAFSNALKEMKTHYPNEFETIVAYLDKIEKAEAAASRARDAILQTETQIEKNQKRKVFSSDKLKDAEYLGEKSTLLIVEGLSAASSMAVSRDRKRYGILAIRGKLINCLAHTDEEIFANEEINLLLSAMNIVPKKYNANKLRYGKIAICADQDSDGKHIGLLIMAAIYKLAPQFLKEGRLCWLQSPLYIEKIGKEEKYYFTDQEIENVEIKGELQRNKGLGSLSPQQAKNSMFNPKNQKMITLIPDEDSLCLLEELMGTDNSYRKSYIFDNVDFSTIHE